MGKRIKVATTQSVAELESAYRRASDPVERSQRQMVWLVANGRTTTEVAEATGYSPDWIRAIIQRFNASGHVGDRRHHNPGGHARALLDANQQAELAQALEGPAPDGGRWSSAKVAAWISARMGRPVGVVRGWEYLQRLTYRPLVPRPRHVQADPEAQEAFQQTGRHCPAGPGDPS
jgi:transposase